MASSSGKPSMTRVACTSVFGVPTKTVTFSVSLTFLLTLNSMLKL